MAGAIRLVSIERGHDPQRFAFVPFGGGGALHAGALIRDVGMRAALVPRFPGVTSALGCVIADIRHDLVQTVNLALSGIDATVLQNRLAAQARAAEALVTETGLAITALKTRFEADMHYLGQTHSIAVRLPDPRSGKLDEAALRAAFEAAYLKNFGRILPGLKIRLVNLRVAAIGKRPRFDLAALAPGPEAGLPAAERGARNVWFGAWREARIYDRLLLPVGAEIPGPAILEQPDATIVVDPGLTARVDTFGNIVMARA
jgi:N-methylhydantoinase A